MLKALHALKADWYVPLSERDSSTPTRFNLRPLDGLEVLDAQLFIDARGNLSMTSDAARAALKSGLTHWENFMEEDGTPLVFNTNDRDANLKRLPAELVVELAMEILVRSRLTPEERKNLSSLPTSRPSSEGLSIAAPAAGGGTATSPIQPDTISSSSSA